VILPTFSEKKSGKLWFSNYGDKSYQPKSTYLEDHILALKGAVLRASLSQLVALFQLCMSKMKSTPFPFSFQLRCFFLSPLFFFSHPLPLPSPSFSTSYTRGQDSVEKL